MVALHTVLTSSYQTGSMQLLNTHSFSFCMVCPQSHLVVGHCHHIGWICKSVAFISSARNLSRDFRAAKSSPPRPQFSPRGLHEPPHFPHAMHRIAPARARMLWGHAPRVRSINRIRRNFATVAGSEKYALTLPKSHTTHPS